MLQTTRYVYEPFAETEDYLAVNRTIVRGWIEMMRQKGNKEICHLLDIATGVGTMAQLFLDNLPENWKQPVVTCLDKSAEALQQVKKVLGPKLGGRLRLVHSSAEDMDLPDHSVDVAVWGNGIHYLDARDQESVLRVIKRVLKPGGWFLFNSAFCAESRSKETIAFYRTQVRKAVRYLHEKGIAREQNDGRPTASEFMPRAHYEGLLNKVGFKLEEVKEVGARLYRTAWEHISNFQQYAAGALHGYRPEAAAEALREAVKPALEEHGQRDECGRPFIERKWLAFAGRVW